jgi:hypothetical protein
MKIVHDNGFRPRKYAKKKPSTSVKVSLTDLEICALKAV